MAGAAIRGGFCISPDLNEWQSQTNAAGEYALLMNTFSGIDLAWCVALVAEAPPGSTFRPDTVRVEEVWFRSRGRADTIQIDFTLHD